MTRCGPPPPPAARPVDEHNRPSATERGGSYRPVGHGNKALEGEVNPRFRKAHHIRSVVQHVRYLLIYLVL